MWIKHCFPKPKPFLPVSPMYNFKVFATHPWHRMTVFGQVVPSKTKLEWFKGNAGCLHLEQLTIDFKTDIFYLQWERKKPTAAINSAWVLVGYIWLKVRGDSEVMPWVKWTSPSTLHSDACTPQLFAPLLTSVPTSKNKDNCLLPWSRKETLPSARGARQFHRNWQQKNRTIVQSTEFDCFFTLVGFLWSSERLLFPGLILCNAMVIKKAPPPQKKTNQTWKLFLCESPKSFFHGDSASGQSTGGSFKKRSFFSDGQEIHTVKARDWLWSFAKGHDLSV